MEPQTGEAQNVAPITPNNEPKESFVASANKVTSFSKILAAVLFIVLPFVGFYLGYMYGTTPEAEVIVAPVAVPPSVASEVQIEESDVPYDIGYVPGSCEGNCDLEYKQGYVRLHKIYTEPLEVTGVATVSWNYYADGWTVTFNPGTSSDAFINLQYAYALVDAEEGNPIDEEICAIVSCPLNPDNNTKTTFSASTTLSMKIHKISKTLETGKESRDSFYVSEVTPK